MNIKHLILAVIATGTTDLLVDLFVVAVAVAAGFVVDVAAFRDCFVADFLLHVERLSDEKRKRKQTANLFFCVGTSFLRFLFAFVACVRDDDDDDDDDDEDEDEDEDDEDDEDDSLRSSS